MWKEALKPSRVSEAVELQDWSIGAGSQNVLAMGQGRKFDLEKTQRTA